MFKLVKERTAWWPVVWNVPTEDGGEVEEVKIELLFVIKDEDGVAELTSKANEIDKVFPDLSPAERRAKAMMPIVRAWRGVGEQGEVDVPLAFTEDHFAALLKLPATYETILAAYGNCANGKGTLRVKN